jgi:hypothetical protein
MILQHQQVLINVRSKSFLLPSKQQQFPLSIQLLQAYHTFRLIGNISPVVSAASGSYHKVVVNVFEDIYLCHFLIDFLNLIQEFGPLGHTLVKEPNRRTYCLAWIRSVTS